uniref:Uncharacterized protein n=1 Tax=Arundo donax TaxID=35708 RepID=A0A0A9AZ64_ARUDO
MAGDKAMDSHVQSDAETAILEEARQRGCGKAESSQRRHLQNGGDYVLQHRVGHAHRAGGRWVEVGGVRDAASCRRVGSTACGAGAASSCFSRSHHRTYPRSHPLPPAALASCNVGCPD